MKDEVIKVANIIIESIVYLFSRGAFVKKFAPPPEDFYSKSHHIRRFSQGTLYQAILKKRLILSSPLSLLSPRISMADQCYFKQTLLPTVGIALMRFRSLVLAPRNNVISLIHLDHSDIEVSSSTVR